MKERPILFSAPMVRAILDGSKTQTRRVLKRQPWASCSIEEGFEGESPYVYSALHGAGPGHDVDESRTPCVCPYGQPGDRLWVRETFGYFIDYDYIDGRMVELGRDLVYRADGEKLKRNTGWKPSIHMPRTASRILLEVVSVRVERLNDISEADCWAEGVEACDGLLDDMQIILFAKQMGLCMEDARATYAALWESINGASSWAANPWVWCMEFKWVQP